MVLRNTLPYYISLLFVFAPESYSQVSSDQESAEDNLKIRMRGGELVSEGRIEIKYGEDWGTVCDDDWSLAGAEVACRMLGFDGALDFVHSGGFGPGEGPILLDNVNCNGDEKSLSDCQHRAFGENDCSHHEDAGIKCNPRRIPHYLLKNWVATADGLVNIRLKTPRGIRKRLPYLIGIVEIFHADKWRTICADGWTQKNAKVVCGQLGFPGAADIRNMYQHIRNSSQLRRKGSFWLTNVTCTGDESKLSQCDFDFLNYTRKEKCPAGEAVLIRCTAGDVYTLSAMKQNMRKLKSTNHHVPKRYTKSHEIIRLKSGPSIGEGRLEVLRDGRWGTVCHNNFDIMDGNVACRQLGFGTAKRILTNSHFGMAHGPIWMANVACSGNESRIQDCDHQRLSEHYSGYRSFDDTEGCTHYDEVGLSCYVPDFGLTRRIRIVGGRNPMEGRVEVQVGRKWGPVCSHDWTATEAMVVCRQLGLGYALQAVQDVWYFAGSEGADEVLMTGTRCSGNEIGLQFCSHDGKKQRKCGDPRRSMTPFAGVICSQGSPDLVLDIPSLQDSVHLEDVSLSRLQCAAEENCLAPSAAEIDLRLSYGIRRLLRFTTRAWNRGRADFRPALTPSDWIWHACHGHFHSMGEFTHYDILSLNKTKMAEGHKASFCLEDSECDDGISKRFDCDQPGGGTQGISVGCADTYLYNIDCQWIDMTDLTAGNYLFRIHVNPNNLVPESDFTNNEVLCNMKYDSTSVWIWNCHIANDYDPTVAAKYYKESNYP